MIRNCLGLTLQDIKQNVIPKLDLFLLDWLMSQQCGGGGNGEAALANFNSYSVFVAKKAIDRLNELDATSGRLDGSDLTSFLSEMLNDLTSDFGRRQCNGQNLGIDEFVSGYLENPYTNLFPSDLPESKKTLLSLTLLVYTIFWSIS